jgi:hypothetical protein
MEKVYNKIDVRFENDYLILLVDNQLIKLKLADISNKLAHATDRERNSYSITPSCYGIHWNLLDEDLSINGLLKKSGR